MSVTLSLLTLFGLLAVFLGLVMLGFLVVDFLDALSTWFGDWHNRGT
jgi:hypothetical protein